MSKQRYWGLDQPERAARARARQSARQSGVARHEQHEAIVQLAGGYTRDGAPCSDCPHIRFLAHALAGQANKKGAAH